MIPRTIALSVLLAAGLPREAMGQWTPLCPGIEVASFDACSKSEYDDSKLVIVRLDPAVARLRVLTTSELGLSKPLRAEEWAERYNMAVVINAGMFAADWRTHLGYLKASDGHTNSRSIPGSYRSVFAFGPRDPALKPAAMFDLEHEEIPALVDRYAAVIQNIRMIRFPGKVVWSRSPRRWSEAALGLDGTGRVLFIFSRSPYPMFDLSVCLLGLPLDLVTAQHLEGGGEATLVIRTPKLSLTLVGSFETGVNDGVTAPYRDVRQSFPIPNVLGAVAQPDCAPGH